MGGIEDWGLTPANAFAGITMRYTQDRRILIRQNIHFSEYASLARRPAQEPTGASTSVQGAISRS